MHVHVDSEETSLVRYHGVAAEREPRHSTTRTGLRAQETNKTSPSQIKTLHRSELASNYSPSPVKMEAHQFCSREQGVRSGQDANGALLELAGRLRRPQISAAHMRWVFGHL